jgi:hypothetical protein
MLFGNGSSGIANRLDPWILKEEIEVLCHNE